MELNDKKVLVVGLAKTGVACARFLASRGARVTVTDMRDEAALAGQLALLEGYGIRRELTRHDEKSFSGSHLIVVSPGVPRTLPQLVMAHEAGVEIMSPHYATLRDGNRTTIPDAYLARDYQEPSFRVTRVAGERGGESPATEREGVSG